MIYFGSAVKYIRHKHSMKGGFSPVKKRIMAALLVAVMTVMMVLPAFAMPPVPSQTSGAAWEEWCRWLDEQNRKDEHHSSSSSSSSSSSVWTPVTPAAPVAMDFLTAFMLYTTLFRPGEAVVGAGAVAGGAGSISNPMLAGKEVTFLFNNAGGGVTPVVVKADASGNASAPAPAGSVGWSVNTKAVAP